VNSSHPKLHEDDALKLSEGDRVHLSELGRSRHSRDTEKKGTIVGQTRYPNSLRIVWDGSRWPIAVHKDYLQRLNEKVSNADERSRHVPAQKHSRKLKLPHFGPSTQNASCPNVIGTSAASEEA
jgi:hypothetical protein